MKTECKILNYNIENNSNSTIEAAIENYCNDSFFNERVVKTISTTQITNDPNNYMITIIYESHIKWLKVLVFFILILLSFAIIFNLFFLASQK